MHGTPISVAEWIVLIYIILSLKSRILRIFLIDGTQLVNSIPLDFLATHYSFSPAASMTTLLLNQTLLLKDHTGPVNVVRYNNDGQYCMTGGHDKTVKLWNPNTGKLIKIYTGHGWEVLSLCM